MSKPAIIPETTTSGIAVDPRTLERVIPESRRPDGSVRKPIKIRPGFTPQEDVRRFRGTRQAQMDATTLPKGHIIGWAPPPAAPKPAASSAALTKSAKKNEKRKEKKKEKRQETVKVKDNWEDEEEEEEASAAGTDGTKASESKGEHTAGNPNWAAAPETKESVAVRQKAKEAEQVTGPARSTDELAEKLDKLEVK